ncbi:MAG: hypothetical protein JNK60_21080 [Acidobacteria bacterium]|nr:hypothetical protein [Acidobacteriota bacterium]
MSRGSLSDLGAALDGLRVQVTKLTADCRGLTTEAARAIAAAERAAREGKAAGRAAEKRDSATSKMKGAAERTSKTGTQGPSTDGLEDLHRLVVSRNARS